MADFSVLVDAPVSAGPGDTVKVTVENWGPSRLFHLVLSIGGHGDRTFAEVTVPRTGRGSVDIHVPDCGLTAPEDVVCIVTTTAEGSADAERTVRFRYLPKGWFDLLDRNLCGSLASYAKGYVIDSDRIEQTDTVADISEAYSALSHLRPRGDAPGRFVRVSDPSSVMDYGDCTEAEAAVAFLADMFRRGYTASMVRLGGAMYVGVSKTFPSKNGICRMGGAEGYVFVRPFDSCNGINVTVSADLSFSRLRPMVGTGQNNQINAAWGISLS